MAGRAEGDGGTGVSWERGVGCPWSSGEPKEKGAQQWKVSRCFPSVSDGAVCVSLRGSGAAYAVSDTALFLLLEQARCHCAPALAACQHLCSSAIKYLLR